MANIKSQIKRIRISERQRQRNKHVRSSLKTHIKHFYEAAGSNNTGAAQERFRVAISALDKAAARKVIHPNNAANKKSSLSKQLNSLMVAK